MGSKTISGVAVPVPVGEGLLVMVAVGDAVFVGDAVHVGVEVRVAVTVDVPVPVVVAVGVKVAVDVHVEVRVAVAVGVAVGVAEAVAVGVRVAVGVACRRYKKTGPDTTPPTSTVNSYTTNPSAFVISVSGGTGSHSPS